MERYVVACDQGTSSSRAVVFGFDGRVVKTAAVPLAVSFPREGWVEQDPRQIWSTQERALAEALQGIPGKAIAALGVTNQRETVLAWDRASGEPLSPAVVWQCRRSSAICEELRSRGLEGQIRATTGLVCDPYFSGTKIRWLLDHTPGLRDAVRSKRAVFGTVDAWTVSQLTRKESRGRVVTEPTNASRTMLFSLDRWGWDPELLELFEIGPDNLPEILPSHGNFGHLEHDGARIPIAAVLGDQQASLLGHGALSAGESKCTFGTGAFLLLHVGSKRPAETAGLIETALWEQGRFALEGSIFVAGAAVQWLRDKLGIVRTSEETEQVALTVSDSGGVIFVPTFVGLGAPHWLPGGRGTMFGVTRDTAPGHIVRATFDGIAHQVADLMELGAFANTAELRIDGGMSANPLFAQTLADLTGVGIRTAGHAEATAFGVAALAAAESGVIDSIERIQDTFGAGQRELRRSYRPAISPDSRRQRRASWKRAIQALIDLGGAPG